MSSRDMTQAQFNAALRKYGMKPGGWGGYVDIPCAVPGRGFMGVCRHNAGPRLRDQLAYLRREQERYNEREIADAKWQAEHETEIALWAQLRKGELS